MAKQYELVFDDFSKADLRVLNKALKKVKEAIESGQSHEKSACL
jgi:hypothetical protein